jgi:UMF1 family MFS transporter
MTTVPNGYTAREQRGWSLYDVANSVFLTSAIAVLLPTFVTRMAEAGADPDGHIRVLGFALLPGGFWGLAVSLSVLLQVLVLPVVGAIADFSRKKRRTLATAAIFGGICATSMVLLQGSHYMLAAGLFILGNVAFGCSNVVYNSFLPEIAPPDQRDGLSSRAWAQGYAAGCVMLVAHLVLLSKAESWGMSAETAVRIALCSTGVWWILWTIPVVQRLRDRGTPQALPPGRSYVSVGFSQMWHTMRDMRNYPHTLKFLIGYLFYNDAIQTVFASAALFGAGELGLSDAELVITILISQVVGVVGALAFGKLAKQISAKYAVIVSLCVWIALLFYAWRFVHTLTEFYIMGAVAGLVMGGTQSLSRSIYSQLVPHGKEAEYFSLYELGDKGTSWLGPLTFSLVYTATGSYRLALLSLLVFFIMGLTVLTRADVKKGEWDVLKSA